LNRIALTPAIALSAIAIEKETQLERQRSGIPTQYATEISNRQKAKKIHYRGSNGVARTVESSPTRMVVTDSLFRA
jgi:hypothetical protein